jgi:rRNA methylases
MDELNRKSVDEFKQAEKIPLIVILENIRSAYNVGSIFRTADAFLIQSVYICGYTAHPPHKEIKKTALGAEDTVHWKYIKDVRDAVREIKEMGFSVYAVEQADNSIHLNKTELKASKVALILGNEVSGVEQSTIEICDGCLEIPQSGMKHSLNVSVAAGIVMWEISKQMC